MDKIALWLPRCRDVIALKLLEGQSKFKQTFFLFKIGLEESDLFFNVMYSLDLVGFFQNSQLKDHDHDHYSDFSPSFKKEEY